MGTIREDLNNDLNEGAALGGDIYGSPSKPGMTDARKERMNYSKNKLKDGSFIG